MLRTPASIWKPTGARPTRWLNGLPSAATSMMHLNFWDRWNDGAPLPAALDRRGSFIVRDANAQALAFVYCEDEPGRQAAN